MSLPVRLRLARWGRWARGGMPSLPTMSSIEKARSGRGGTPNLEMPADVAEVDHLVTRAPPDYKQVLIVYYCQQGRKREKAHHCGLTVWSFERRLERGESYVAINL